MQRSLAGRSILVAEDEALIALDIKQAFEEEGAKVIIAHTLAGALRAVDEPTLSAAILDHALSDGDSAQLCIRMKERNLPFVIYSGYNNLSGACSGAVHVKKPESTSVLVETVKGLLADAGLRARVPIEISEASAKDIAIEFDGPASNVVMSLGDRWFDIRHMTTDEILAHVASLSGGGGVEN